MDIGPLSRYYVDKCPHSRYYCVDISLHSKGLVTNYGEGGATKREGGAREVLPLRKGGGRKKFKPC